MSLFEQQVHRPLADRLRPASLDEYVGQQHILGPGQYLRVMIEQKRPESLIFWGPPGVGKTTLARLIAKTSDYDYSELSAVTSGIADVKKVIEQARAAQSLGRNTLLFVDEIHRFNKAQQDAFLPHVESGVITLIGATTENPSFEVISPLLSRAKVLTLEPLSKDELLVVIERAMGELSGKKLGAGTAEAIAELAAGDARQALNIVESAARLGGKTITVKQAAEAAQHHAAAYDKTGEYHYNLISAFIKSLRGSHADAALFYLQRMLEGGEDPKFIARRLVIFASEDVGMASPHALTLAVAVFQAVERIGMPEANYALVHGTVAMAKAPKSRALADAMYGAKKAVKQHPKAAVPLHLRNAPTKLMKDLGYQKGYEWEADFKHDGGFLADDLKDAKFYQERP